MARSVNLTILLGNVGADPEIRYTSNRTPVARFSLATNSQYTDTSTGELKEITSWHNLVMYGKKPADVIQKYVKKGNPLHVVSHIAYRTWTDNDKVKHHHTAIVIDSFTLLGRPTFQTGESLPESDDGDATVALNADGSSELTDNITSFRSRPARTKGQSRRCSLEPIINSKGKQRQLCEKQNHARCKQLYRS